MWFVEGTRGWVMPKTLVAVHGNILLDTATHCFPELSLRNETVLSRMFPPEGRPGMLGGRIVVGASPTAVDGQPAPAGR